MSLKIWLPLNGTLENKDCANGNLTITTTPTWSATSKLGQAMSAGACKMDATMTASILNNKEFSLCFWVYINEATGTSGSPMFFGNNPMGENNNRKFSVFSYPTCNDIHLSWMNDAANATFAGGVWSGVCPSYKWTHVAITYKNPTGNVYINGVKQNGFSGVSNSSTFAYETNLFSNAGTKRYINDYRVYDTCLTQAEVKEIAQCLVLHYKFDKPIENWLANSCPNSNSASGWSYAGTGWANSIQANSFSPSGYVIRCTYSGTSATQGGMYHSVTDVANLTNGAKYTVSCWARASKACTAYFYQEQFSTYSPANTISLTTEWKKYYCTGTVDTSKTYKACILYVVGSSVTQDMWIECCQMKFEQGETATEWTPHTSDASYKSVGFNDATLSDSSGYGHNATITGTPVAITDVQRQITALHFTDTSQKCNVTGITTSAFSNSYSIAWWGKCATFSNVMQWGFSNGVRLNGIYNGTLWNTGDGSNNPLYKPGTTTQVSAPSVNVWHHFVMTGDGTTCKVYMDGVHWATAKTYKTITGTSIYFNGWDSSTSYSNSDLYLSDFRMYATVLSDTDILNLYKSYTKIAKPESLHVYSFNEDGATASITTNGVTHNTHIIENGAKYNAVSSFSYKPAANTNNSCINTAIADFTLLRNIGKPMSFLVECDVAWSNWGWGTGGTTRLYFQGSNRKIATGSFAWEGTNYIAGWNITTNVTNASSGTLHLSKTVTIPATWFDTYDASYFGMRCDYSNGSGTVSVTNFKVTLDSTNTKFSSKYFAANELVEI